MGYVVDETEGASKITKPSGNNNSDQLVYAPVPGVAAFFKLKL